MEGLRCQTIANAGARNLLLQQELPCRRCTDKNDGVEVWLPLSKFTTAQEPAELLNTLRKGKGLACFRCARDLAWKPHTDEVIPCERCGLILSRNNYNPEIRKIWESLGSADIYCLKCLGEKVRRAQPSVLPCHGACQKKSLRITSTRRR